MRQRPGECTAPAIHLAVAESAKLTTTSRLAAKSRPCPFTLSLPEEVTITQSTTLLTSALDVNSREDLAETLHAAVNDPRIREKVIANAGEALRQELYGPDGRSVERTVKVILELGARH